MSIPEIVIEKGIPLPDPDRWGGRCTTPMGRAMSAMEIGDSFAIPVTPDDQERRRNQVTAAQSARRPKKFRSRVQMENGGQVLRVWRVE